MIKKIWSEKEESDITQLLKEEDKYTYWELAEVFNASIEATRSFCRKLGLEKNVKESTSVGEEKLWSILRNIFPQEKIIKQKNVGEGLPLDFYLPDINLGFEYDGIQHYEWPNYFHKTKEEFLEQQERDKRKEELCVARGINLIRLRYDEELTRELVLSKYKEHGEGTGEYTKDAVLTYKERVKSYKQNREAILKEKNAEYIKEIRAKANLIAKEKRRAYYQKVKEFKEKERE